MQMSDMALQENEQTYPMNARSIRHKSEVTRNALWMFISRILGFVLQAAYFVLLARVLGVKEYGIFAGVFALVNTFTPYSALGSAMLFLRYLAADKSHASVYWGNSLITTATFTSVMVACVLIFVAGGHGLNHPGTIVVLIIANCYFLQVTTLGSMLMFSLGSARTSAWMGLLTNLFRVFVLLAIYIRAGHANAFQWSIGVLLASALAAGIVAYLVRRRVGQVRSCWKLLRYRTLEGLGFAFAGTTEAVNNDLDKIMLSHYGMDTQNGFYTLAYRVVDFATSPIGALSAAVMQRQFILASQGLRPMMCLARKSLAAGISLGMVIGIGTLFLAPIVPRIAGKEFVVVIQVLQYLCWLPLIRSIHQLSGCVVTAAGNQNWRTGAQLAVALLNIGLNWAWIPRYGWIGACWSTLASDGSLAILNCLLLIAIQSQIIHQKSASATENTGRA